MKNIIITLFILFNIENAYEEDELYPTINGCKLEPKTSCPKVDLSNRNLSNLDLKESNFEGANFEGAILDGTDLTKSILKISKKREILTHYLSLIYLRVLHLDHVNKLNLRQVKKCFICSRVLLAVMDSGFDLKYIINTSIFLPEIKIL